MKLIHKKILILGGVLLVVLFALGVWLLLNPANPFNSLFRSDISTTDGKVITGPYPVEADFKKLKKSKVETVVSLLDDRLPYEAILIEKERKMAEKYHMKLLNFPMASILGQRLGTDYNGRVQAAADSILSQKGRVYLHCYLGVHRAQDVEAKVASMGVTTGQYTARQKPEDEEKVEEAEELYEKEQFAESVQIVNSLDNPDLRGQIVRAWSYYRLNHADSSYREFYNIIQEYPDLTEPRSGLGYSALRLGRNEAAKEQFEWLVEQQPTNSSSLYGLALAHYHLGEIAEARTYAELAVKAMPSNEEAKVLVETLSQNNPFGKQKPRLRVNSR